MRPRISKFIFITLIVFLLGALTRSTFAQTGGSPAPAPAPTPGPLTIYNPIHATDVPMLINDVITAILGIVGALALFMFVYGGMLWMTSAGNSQRIEKGKETLTWSVIGLFVIFASYAILRFVLEAISG